jgi:hypothetical protein
MQLNLPIVDQLKDSQSILIAGAGGGFDVFIGLPIYFTLKAMGKNVHLANYSFSDMSLSKIVGEPIVLLENRLVGARGKVSRNLPYYPEGYLSQWFQEVRGEDVTIWMLPNEGAIPVREGYIELINHLKTDALILVDGGVDSIMRGDETAPGTLIEDSITLAVVDDLNIPVKLQVCLGFGTEVEERVCHHHALENIAALAKAGGFLGSCALTPQMEVFQLYEAACRYVWEQPLHSKSHISTRIIPAVQGEFGSYDMYETTANSFISPLMSLYWFFDANEVIGQSLLVEQFKFTRTKKDAIAIFMLIHPLLDKRPIQRIPY